MSTVMEEEQQNQSLISPNLESVKSLGQEPDSSFQSNFDLRQETLIEKKKPKKKRSLRAIDGDEAMRNQNYKSFRETLAESCPVCGKIFSSKKAMFGHMRCHSYKERRERRRTFTTSDSGLKRKLQTPEIAEQADDKEVPERTPSEKDIRSMFRPWNDEKKAKFLQQLVNNKARQNEQKLEILELVPKNAEPLSESDDKKANNAVSTAPEHTENGKLEHYSITLPVRNSHTDSIMLDNDSENQSTLLVRTTKEVDQVEKSTIDEELKFKCFICNKAFRTHQALGGHKSSHYKFAKQASEIKLTIDDPEKSVAVLEEQQHQPIPKLTQTVGSHKCDICGKTFTKGQSLGGHKRLHWVKPVVNTSTATAASDVIPERNDHSHTVCKNVFDIDLNERPVTEEETKMTLLPLFAQ